MRQSFQCGNRWLSTCASESNVSIVPASSSIHSRAEEQTYTLLKAPLPTMCFVCVKICRVQSEKPACKHQAAVNSTYPSPMLLWAVLGNILLHIWQVSLSRCHFSVQWVPRDSTRKAGKISAGVENNAGAQQGLCLGHRSAKH